MLNLDSSFPLPCPEYLCVDLMERLFQGLLVLRTRCLECECHAKRREDFQDISAPVQADEHRGPDNSSECEGCYYVYTHSHRVLV